MPKTAKPSNKSNRALPYPTISTTDPVMTSPTSPASGTRSACPWSTQEDATLKQARQKGMNWQPIADKYFPGKTANACRKRHERLVDKQKTTEDWDERKLQALAQQYVELREQMWRLLASRIGEKWQIVESKCMERGVKSLIREGRSRARRDGGIGDDIPGSDGFNDSGLCLGPDAAQQPDPYPASDLGHSHSSRRSTCGSVSSFNPTNTLPTTPQMPFAASPQAQNSPYQYPPQPPTTSTYQPPSKIISQQQQYRQNLPSISHLMATAAPPRPGSVAVTTH